MKTIVFSSYDDLKNPVYSGGGAMSVHEIARRLAREYKVTVLTGTYKGAKNEVIDRVNYIRTGSDIFGHKIGQLIYQIALLKYVLTLDYNIWIESSTPPFTFSLLPLFTGKPLISWIHMLSSYDMQRKYFLNFRIIEQLLAKLYKSFIVPTDWVHKEVSRMNKNAKIIRIPPCGYNLNSVKTISALRKSYGKYVLYIGRIEVDQKGLDLLIKALVFVKSNIKAVIAGSGASEEMQKLHNLIKEYKVENKVIIIDRVKDIEKTNLYKGAIATIVPSRFETFSMVSLESIGLGKQVICFDIPQLAWIPDAYAIKVTPFDVRKISKTIDKLSAQKTTLLPIETVKPFMQQFAWDSIVSRFEKLVPVIVQ